MSKTTAELLRRELERRQGPLSSLFEQQLKAATDPSKQKAYLTTRRAGKTRCVVTEFLAGAVKHPNSRYVHVGKTGKSVRNAAWSVIRELSLRYNLNARLQETHLRAILPNGSEIELYGADKADWMDRMRGPSFRGVNIDEAAFYKIDLQVFAREVIFPALTDHRGSLVLTSTPGRVKHGYFYEITCKKSLGGWSIHQWSAHDNPYIAVQFQEEIARLHNENPNVASEPWYRREYLGEWAFDEGDFVYAFDAETNLVDEPEKLAAPRFILGIDLGYAPDATAFSLIQWSPESPRVTEIESYKSTELHLDQIAELVRDYIKTYPNLFCVADFYNKQTIEELRKRYGLPLVAANKTEKSAVIDLLNSDMRAGLISIVDEACEPHLQELDQLTWTDKGLTRIENPVVHNDCCDAFLMAWRQAYHFRHEPREQTPQDGTPEFIRKQAEDRKRRFLERERTRQRRKW